MNEHLEYMRRAYELALKGWGRVSPNPMVGAVVVKRGRVIGEGWHPFCGGPHAEIVAIQNAGKAARGADLYVTLEPCCHFGRTPPCTETILRSGIGRVFVGALDPNPKMNGGSIRLLRREGIPVMTGVLEAECEGLNRPFAKFITSGMPFVTAKIAQTLDGKIALPDGTSRWITGEEARAYSRQRRFGFDAIMVGVNTVLNDDPVLDAAPRKRIKKIILDTDLRAPAKAAIFTRTRPDDLLIFTGKRSAKKLPAQMIVAPVKNGRIDLDWVMKYLGGQKIAHVLIEGGGKVIGDALRRGLVDHVMIYIAPKIMGEGKSGVQGLRAASMDALIGLHSVSRLSLGEDVLIEGYLK